MSDFALPWGEDLDVSATGDILLTDGPELTQQRIQRRLFTAVRGYVWHQEYGMGLPQRIGRVARERNIQALVRSHINLETTVAKIPVPVVKVTQSTAVVGLFVIEIIYKDSLTGSAVAINLEVPSRQ